MSSQWLLLLLFVLCPCVLSIKICAFNMHHFSEKKVAKEHVLNNIVKILQRCDLSLLQEVQDPKGLAVSKLLTAMNKPYIWDMFQSVSSPQLGRKSYTEQYVFIYRPDKVTVMDQYKYADNSLSAPDVFAREPYIVLFQLPTTDLKDLVLVPQHTEPEKAAVELEALYDVFLDVKKRWSSRNIMFLGDFNADCRFLSKKKRRSLQLYSNQDFHWLIDDSTDTTVRGSTDCAYDRIVVYGNELKELVVSASVYNFTKEMRLSEAQALEVSDHYPVEVDLREMSGQSILSSSPLIVLSLLAACKVAQSS